MMAKEQVITMTDNECDHDHGICTDIAHGMMNRIFTHANINKYTSDEELETKVHSIVGRLWEQCFYNSSDVKPTDKMLHILAKGLRTPK